MPRVAHNDPDIAPPETIVQVTAPRLPRAERIRQDLERRAAKLARSQRRCTGNLSDEDIALVKATEARRAKRQAIEAALPTPQDVDRFIAEKGATKLSPWTRAKARQRATANISRRYQT